MRVRVFSINQAKMRMSRPNLPDVLATVDEFVIRLVKFRGEFGSWHSHENEDEAFVVLEGEVNFQTADGNFELQPGEGIVIPKGLSHCPKACDDGPMPLALVIEHADKKRHGS